MPPAPSRLTMQNEPARTSPMIGSSSPAPIRSSGVVSLGQTLKSPGYWAPHVGHRRHPDVPPPEVRRFGSSRRVTTSLIDGHESRRVKSGASSAELAYTLRLRGLPELAEHATLPT